MTTSKHVFAPLAALSLLLGAGVTGLLTTSATKVEAQGISDYTRCYFQGQDDCYPRTPDGMIYLPSWDSPEGEAFEQCLAEVEIRCSALYPQG